MTITSCQSQFVAPSNVLANRQQRQLERDITYSRHQVAIQINTQDPNNSGTHSEGNGSSLLQIADDVPDLRLVRM